MRTPSVSRRSRGAVRFGAACVATAGLVTLAAATPAAADSDQLWIQAPYRSTVPKAADSGPQPPASTLALGLYHDNDTFTVTDGRLTVDVSGLAGVAEVTWPENCAPAGTTAVCTVPKVPSTYTEQLPLQVRAAAGAGVGATGRITYTAKAATTMPGGELTAAEGYETTITVGSGPDLVLDQPARVEGVRPGSTVPVPFSVVNRGNEPARGVKVTLYVTRGLDVGSVAPQCTAGPAGEDGPVRPVTKLECAFDTVVEPGGTFALPRPLNAVVARHALYERVDMGVAPGAGAEDLTPEDNGALVEIKAANTADFAVRGARVSGAAGRTVTADLTFRNRGPAWVANLGAGDPVARVDLVVPEGATVTGVPADCEARTLRGEWYDGTTGAPRYACNLPMWVAEKQTATFRFQLRIDTVVPRATGAVRLMPSYGDGTLSFDPDTANNTAALVLNPRA
ncbi:hypothetical protein ACIRD2_14290 [Streptomyces sp. NPDC093595]|uniref:hypothetical protein n=1 Tax=Streptomyces sp. NPDC093595 TaxID=3366045 RepID=UPI00381A0676